jgi:hypothetical protein
MHILHTKLSHKAVVFVDDGDRSGEREMVLDWTRCFPEFRANYMHTLTGYWTVQRMASEAKIVSMDHKSVTSARSLQDL